MMNRIELPSEKLSRLMRERHDLLYFLEGKEDLSNASVNALVVTRLGEINRELKKIYLTV